MREEVGAQRRCLTRWRAASVGEDFLEEETGRTVFWLSSPTVPPQNTPSQPFFLGGLFMSTL